MVDGGMWVAGGGVGWCLGRQGVVVRMRVLGACLLAFGLPLLCFWGRALWFSSFFGFFLPFFFEPPSIW